MTRFSIARWWAPRIGLALLVGALFGCGARTSNVLSPHESLLSIANEYELFRAVDLYRDSYPLDMTGQNVARATLIRLANYEDLYPGKFTPEIEMLRGQAFADLGDYASARQAFDRCKQFDTPLREKAAESSRIAGEYSDLLGRKLDTSSIEAHVSDTDRQIASLQGLAARYRATRWETLARIEIESAEVFRAELLASNQFSIPNGQQRAREALEQVVKNHPESRRALGHALRLAQFHIEQARLQERLYDPERGSFDYVAFSSNLETALDILHRVSLADGHPEKLVARHLLDETLAYYDMVRDRAQ